MPFDDLRTFIQKLEAEGELVRIGREVDWNEEAGAIVRRSSELGLPGILIENVKDYPDRRLAGGLMSSIRRVALALDLPANTPIPQLMAEFLSRTKEPVKPIIVKSGPCKENICLGDKVDLWSLPAPLVHARDGGRYLCTWHVVVIKDPDSDWINWGMYRAMVQDKNKLGILIQQNQHIFQIFRKYEARNQPMEIAIAIGVEPMSTFAACTFFPPMLTEADMVGALRGKPIELVPCETVDLQVPATAEIVIEGLVRPGVRAPEGPFGEYTGYRASDRDMRPVVEVSAVTHRDNPIVTMSCEGVPVTETHANTSITKSAMVERELRAKGFPIRGVWIYPESCIQLGVVSTKATFGNIAAVIAHTVWSTAAAYALPFLIIVEDDVDPYSWSEVMHALATRCHPYRGVRPSEFEASNPLDPRLPIQERRLGLGAKVYFDCTWPVNWDREEVPQLISFNTAYSEEIRQKVLQQWGSYGFKA